MYASRDLGFTDEPTRTDETHDQKPYHSQLGESERKTYNNLQPLQTSQLSFPVSHANTDSTFISYEFMEPSTTGSPPTGVNFVGCQSGQQNVLNGHGVNRHFSTEDPTCYHPHTLQSSSPNSRTDPIVGLAQLAEKANFSGELAEFGDTRSGSDARNSLPRIERSFSFPTSPNLRHSLMETGRVGYEHLREGFQGSFMDDSMSNSLYPVPGSTMSDMSRSRHHIRQQHRQSAYMFPEHGHKHPLSPPGRYSQYSYPDERELRSFDYYQTLNKDKSGVIPNVTVFNTDPQSKSPQFFAPEKSRSEEILKKTLSTFGKIFSPTEDDEERRDGDKWASTNENKKDKRCSSSKGSTNCAPEQGNDNRLCACKWMGCDAIYSEQDDLVRHIEKVHIDQRKADDLYICYWEQCTRQTKPFNARYKLVIHMRVHSGEKPNKCTVSIPNIAKINLKSKTELVQLITKALLKEVLRMNATFYILFLITVNNSV